MRGVRRVTETRVSRYAVLGMAFLTFSCAALDQKPIRPDDLHFHNLQVLPVNIPRDDLLDTMVAFSGALGVHCDHCHVKIASEPEEKFDFPRDDMPEKSVARTMIRMTNAINRHYIERVSEDGSKVICGTCHRGETVPPGWTPLSVPKLPSQ